MLVLGAHAALSSAGLWRLSSSVAVRSAAARGGRRRRGRLRSGTRGEMRMNRMMSEIFHLHQGGASECTARELRPSAVHCCTDPEAPSALPSAPCTVPPAPGLALTEKCTDTRV